MLDCLLEGTTMGLSSLERARHWKAVKLRSHWMEAKTWSHQDAQLHYGMRMGLSRWRRSQRPPVLGRRALREAMPRIPLGKLHASSVQHPMYPSSGELCARGRQTDAALQSPRISRSRRLAEDRTELQSLSASSCQRGRGCRAALTWHGGQQGEGVFRMSCVRDNTVMSRPAKANFGTAESTLPIKTSARRQACSWSMGAWFTDESSRRRVRRDEQRWQGVASCSPNSRAVTSCRHYRRRLRTWWRAAGSCLPHGCSMNSLWDVRGHVSKCAKSAKTPCEEEEEACIRKRRSSSGYSGTREDARQ